MGLILVLYYKICHQQTTSTQINLCIFKTATAVRYGHEFKSFPDEMYEVWRNEENHF